MIARHRHLSSWFRHRGALAVPISVLLFSLVLGAAGVALADTFTFTFETPTYLAEPGHPINGQDGWVALGAAAGPGCTNANVHYDHHIVALSGSQGAAYPTFGDQSLQMSSAVVSGEFGCQTYSKPLLNEAGETTADSGSNHAGGTRQRRFEAEWDFAPFTSGLEQDGQFVNVSPDRGDGARMAFIKMKDDTAANGGLQVQFADYQVRPVASGGEDFYTRTVASGLSRTSSHHIKITVDFVDGAQNDIVTVYVDGTQKLVGTTWEDYYRNQENTSTRPVDSLLFHTRTSDGSGSTPLYAGAGFLIDNVKVTSTTAPAAPSAVFVRQDGDDLNCDGSTNASAASAPDGKCAWATIQHGISAVADPGTVNIGPGTYTAPDAQINTTKSLVIKGSGRSGPNATILDGLAATSLHGIHFAAGTTNAAVRDLMVTRFPVHGVYADGPFTNFTVDNVESSVNGRLDASGRGIVVWNGFRNGVTITNNVTNNNALVGIGFQDGSASNVTITGNTVVGNGDDGIFALGLTGPGANIISGNTVTNNGRFGIDIALPDGNGAASGAGSIVIDGNTVSQTVSADALPATAANKLKDHAGIVVMHRYNGGANADVDNGVVVQNNVVSGIRANAAGTTGQGFGIVVAGTNMAVRNNVVSNNDVGIQAQQGNPNPDPAAGSQSTDYFDRDNAATFTGVIELNDIQTSNTIGARGVGLTSSTNFSRNWWGNASGPTTTANTGGTGSAVAGANVRFAPWLGDGTDTSAAIGFQPNATTLRTGVSITPTTGLTTTEAGGTANFSIVLTVAPTADVTINLTSSNTNEGTVSPSSVTFTPANYTTPRNVVVTGNANAPFNGNVAYTIVTSAITSTDPAFSGVNPDDVSVTNTASGGAVASIANGELVGSPGTELEFAL